MINQVSIALIGFSVIALILLIFQQRSESRITKLLATILLCVLIGVQLLRGLYITDYLLLKDGVVFIYLLLLGFVGPLFYLYSQYVINSEKKWTWRESVHFFAIILIALGGYSFPEYFNIAYSLLFFIGGLYMGRLAWLLFQLRVRRTLFKIEFLSAVLLLSWAIAVVFIGVLSTQAMELLIPTQSIMLAIAIAASIYVQLNYPHLLSSLEEIAHSQYQASTLLNVDCDNAKKQLNELMSDKDVYQDSELSLTTLAEMLSLKSYQLSELINTQLGLSFSSFLRRERVRAAETLLKVEPDVSVLAIGLSVGFRSQSAFYSAFKEFHAMAPGQYRQQILTQ